MTIKEAITAIDNLKPNSYSESEKVKWLSQVEWHIKSDIIDNYIYNEGETVITFNGYTDNTDKDTKLIAYEPYDVVYLRWLEAQIDYANGETARYNNSQYMFNEAFNEFGKAWHKTHKHKVNPLRFF